MRDHFGLRRSSTTLGGTTLAQTLYIYHEAAGRRLGPGVPEAFNGGRAQTVGVFKTEALRHLVKLAPEGFGILRALLRLFFQRMKDDFFESRWNRRDKLARIARRLRRMFDGDGERRSAVEGCRAR